MGEKVRASDKAATERSIPSSRLESATALRICFWPGRSHAKRKRRLVEFALEVRHQRADGPVA